MTSWSWSPKTHTHRFTQKINSALQIQFLVGPDYDRDQVWCTSVNIFLQQRGKGHQEEVNTWWFSVQLYHPLRLITWKQWILADLWDKKRHELEPRVKGLLAAYIFYYEQILDRVLPLQDEDDSDEAHLKKWFELDVTSGDHTRVSLESYICIGDQEGPEYYAVWAEKSADKAALSWGFYEFFSLGRWDKVDEQSKANTFSKVLQWLTGHRHLRWDDNVWQRL
ncbi:hypothetical protein M413DRAFT_443218 [Hebeloma cylindrosporum]|uniref:Uncharacterized protein n=1 Tax=Hebeloma cylindrosporum TaxID=76867 RepID=A0A0C3CK97_HEBCY|nr:hypothetical protein M413DRAFT_443218 [Hebeloma cylindrosporum h7]